MTVQQVAAPESRQQGIARRIRGLMGEQRINGTRVGRAIGVSNVAVSRRLQSHVEFTPSEIEALAELFGVGEVYLYGFSDVRHEGLEPPTRWFVVPRRLAEVIDLDAHRLRRAS
jgi:transcriptional regulator with XRE-family HTH domain